ncbi:MAG: Lon-like protease helical domain-containing protein, partial [Desulfobacterales bacterium]
LKPDQLRVCCPAEQFDFDSTDELEDLDDFIGQPRALAALDFGIGMRGDGYHIFALGENGAGKYSLIRRFLEKQAAAEEVPPDICYVNNFDEQHKPRILVMEAGTGKELADRVKNLVEDVRNALRAALESEDFQARRQSVQQELQEKQQKAFEKLQQMSQERDLTPLRTPAGLVFAPVRDGEVLDPSELEKLSEEERGELEKKAEELQQEAQKVFQKIPQWQREIREKQKELNREATQYAVGPVFEELRGRYEGRPAVTEYLESMEKDIVDSAHVLFQSEGGQG